MKTVIYLNKWNRLYHLMLAVVDGEESRRLDSRYARSLDQARKAVVMAKKKQPPKTYTVELTEGEIEMLSGCLDGSISRTRPYDPMYHLWYKLRKTIGDKENLPLPDHPPRYIKQKD